MIYFAFTFLFINYQLKSKKQGETELLVPVTSARGHLQNLALAITSNLPVLISGPVGCGKIFSLLTINTFSIL